MISIFYKLHMSIKNLVGATTVSGTMVAAAMAGISIFVTGGIGGVHHGADKCKHKLSTLHSLKWSPHFCMCSVALS